MNLKSRSKGNPSLNISSSESISFQSYIAQIKSFEIISHDETIRLFKKYRETGEQVYADKIIQSNLRFSISVAKKHQGCSLPLMDIIQQANIGLQLALERFDPDKGIKFISYAKYWMIKSILEEVISVSKIVRSSASHFYYMNKLRDADYTLRERLFYSSDEEIDSAHLYYKDNIDRYSAPSYSKNYSLDDLVDNENISMSLGEMIADDSINIESQIFSNMIYGDLTRFFSTLDQVDIDIIQLKFGYYSNKINDAKISESLKVSEKHIRSVSNKFKKMIIDIYKNDRFVDEIQNDYLSVKVKY